MNGKLRKFLEEIVKFNTEAQEESETWQTRNVFHDLFPEMIRLPPQSNISRFTPFSNFTYDPFEWF